MSAASHRLWAILLLSGCVVVGGLLAWQRLENAPPVPVPRTASPNPWDVDDLAPSPTSLAANPLAVAGLERLDAPPAGAKAPPGGQFRHAHRRRLEGGWAETAVYLAPGPAETLRAFYETALPSEGFKLVSSHAGLREGSVVMTFVRNGRYTLVHLAPGSECVTVSQTFLPSGSAPG